MNTPLLDYRPELEFLPLPAARPPGAAAPPDHSLALAAALLEVDSEAGLEEFFAGLFDQARAGSHAPLAPPQARALRRAVTAGLRQASHLALPLGPAPLAGPVIAALGRGGASALRRCAAQVFGLELEGLSPEDKEFELARHFVCFADRAARAALQAGAQLGSVVAPQLRERAVAVAQAALTQAARRYAPGLLTHCARASGQWRRQGGRITVFDC